MGSKKKITIKEVPSTNLLSRKATNRERVRRQRYWEKLPATGALPALLEKHIAELKDDVRLQYSPSALVTDAEEFLEDPDDLVVCRKNGIPVTQRHMDYLLANVEALKALGVEEMARTAKTEVVGEDAAVAMQDVVDARNIMAEWANASGLPRSTFEIRRSLGSPLALYNRVVLIIDAVTADLPAYQNPTAAKQHLENLKRANETLAKVAGFRGALKSHRTQTNTRRRILTRNMYELMIWLSGWGRTLFAITKDQDLLRRWSLDKTFPNQRANAKGSLEDAVKNALTPPADVG